MEDEEKELNSSSGIDLAYHIQVLQLEEMKKMVKILDESAKDTNYQLRRMATRLEEMNK